MGFAFFKDTTEDWIFGPQPPPDPPIPPEFYERKNYVPFNKEIPAADLPGINGQQALRNVAFLDWLPNVRAALAAVGLDMQYNVIHVIDAFYTQPVSAEVRVGKLEVGLSLSHYDIWSPGQAAEQLRRDSKRIV